MPSYWTEAKHFVGPFYFFFEVENRFIGNAAVKHRSSADDIHVTYSLS